MRCLLITLALAVVASATYYGDNEYLTPRQRYARLLSGRSDVFDEQDGLFGGLHDILRYEYDDDIDQQDERYDEPSGNCRRRYQQYDQRRQRSMDDEQEFDDDQQQTEEELIRAGIRTGNRRQCTPKYHLLPEIEESNCQLAANLYRQAKQESDDKNIVVSPSAVHIGLAALTQATRGSTKRQIGVVTGGRLPEHEKTGVFVALARSLRRGQTERDDDYDGQYQYRRQPQQQKRTKIDTITGIFISRSTPAQRQFVEKVQRCLGVKLNKCDFERRPQQCRQQINRFVSERTQNKINQILPTDAVTDSTKMIVVNGLQLKANWGKQFRQHVTTTGPFFPLSTQKVKQVPIMKSRGTYNYHESENVKIVGIPTENRELTMYVILPKEKRGLADVETENPLDGQKLKLLLDNCDRRTERVEVHLPKFQIRHKTDVRRTLMNQGVTDIFDVKRADFTPITGTECDVDNVGQCKSLHLNKFLHHASIKVTDNGITTGTGNTGNYESQEEEYYGRRQHQPQYEQDLFEQYGQDDEHDYRTQRDMFEEVVGVGSGSGSGRKLFKCDHPFAFVVRHNPTNQVLLFGRVIDAGQKLTRNVAQSGEYEPSI